MKKNLFFVFALIALSFTPVADTLSEKERSDAVKLLTDTEKDVFSKVKGLSEAQLKYKPAPDRWSVEECVKHIAISEKELRQLIDGTLKQAPNPDKRSEIKNSDEQVVKMVENRTQKVKTTEQLKPENTPYKSEQEALASFKTNREKLIQFVKATQGDLRNHVATMPFGQIDSYQLILFLAAHSNRHTQQIEEVKADAGFPKN